MGTQKRSKEDNLLFNSLVQLLKNQQEQLKTLVEERKILEDRIKSQHERWISDIRHCEDHIYQLKDALIEKEITCLLQAAKSELMLGLKNREACLHKLKLEQTQEELSDFRSCLDCTSQILEKKSKEGVRGSHLKSSGSKKLDNEVRRLKSEYERLASEKNSEISALLKEKSFVWNQYNVLESSLNDKLKSKQSEVDHANSKIAKILATVQMLQSSNNEKDEAIRTLKSKLVEVEADGDKSKQEISRLSTELETLKKSRSAQVTPALKHGNIGAEASNRVVKSNSRKGSNVVVKKELTPAKAAAPLKDSEKGIRGSKRKEAEAFTILETPKLFSATFKVPKLKTPSIQVT